MTTQIKLTMIHASLFFLAILVNAALALDQFGPLMQSYLPVGERLAGFPEVFPGLSTDSPRYLVFPEDSAATFEESGNRCRALNGNLVNLGGPHDMDIFGNCCQHRHL